MIVLYQCLADYLSVRRALGFQLQRRAHQLADFIGFMEREGTTTVTTRLALAWATETTGSMNCRADRLGAVRAFARYLQAIDPSTEVPPARVLPRTNSRAKPYIYNDAEISALMAAAQTLRSPLLRATYATLIGLLAVTGMRPGEALGLDRDDVDWEHGVLTVRRAKFGKSREVAVRPSTLAALEMYSRSRDELVGHQNDHSFFLSIAGTKLNHHDVNRTFRRLEDYAGLDRPQQGCPRLQDFRHYVDGLVMCRSGLFALAGALPAVIVSA